jgi:hypothetical protein
LNDVKITEIDSGVRALTDTELMMVAGGGNGSSLGTPNFWWNVGKMVAIGTGSALGGPFGAVVFGLAVISAQGCFTGDAPEAGCDGTLFKPASPGAQPM